MTEMRLNNERFYKVVLLAGRTQQIKFYRQSHNLITFDKRFQRFCHETKNNFNFVSVGNELSKSTYLLTELLIRCFPITFRLLPQIFNFESFDKMNFLFKKANWLFAVFLSSFPFHISKTFIQILSGKSLYCNKFGSHTILKVDLTRIRLKKKKMRSFI